MTSVGRRLAIILPVITALLLISSGVALADEPWVNDPAGAQAKAIQPVYWILFVFAVVVLLVVDGALIYAGVKFRERPGHVAKQFHDHDLLELTWTVIPTIMVIGFSILSFQRLLYLNDAVTDAQMTVKVEGRQWTWSYSYPDEPRFRTNDGLLKGAEEIHIPVDTKVRLELSSKDVIHSFFVPRLGGKKDAVPGRATDLWLQAERPGTYKGQCAEFCGDGHADMLIVVVAHPKAEYDAWAREAVTRANRAVGPEARRGKQLFESLACANCHLVRGTVAAGRVGPELSNIAARKTIAGVLSPVNEENLKRWIKNPPGAKPGTQMPNLGLPDEQIHDIVQYLLTLDGK